MWTAAFCKDAAERATKSFVQALLVAGVMTQVFASASNYDWGSAISQGGTALIVALGVAFVSFLTSLGSAPFSAKGTASLTDEVEYKA